MPTFAEIDELVLELALSRDSLAPLAGSVRGPDSPASRRASNVPSLPPSRAWIEKWIESPANFERLALSSRSTEVDLVDLLTSSTRSLDEIYEVYL